jgi:hypothetical protein
MKSPAQTGKAPKINLKLARKVLDVVDAGLVAGLGKPEPGQMCIEAAVNYALGAEHGDEPACVGRAVRAFKIRLNDCAWLSIEARTKGMRKLAIAQLGSDTLDQMEFGKLMFLRGTQKLMPYVFRLTAEKRNPKYKDDYLKHADICEKVKTFEEAKMACKNANANAYAYAYAYAAAAAAAYADADAYADAYACAAYAYASAADKLLQLTADVGLQCLIELKSPGCKWLWLCEEK